MNSLQTRDAVLLGERRWQLHRLDRLEVERLPFTLKVLLENLLRHEDGRLVTAEQVEAVRRWDSAAAPPRDEVDLHPTRVFLHDTNRGCRMPSSPRPPSRWCWRGDGIGSATGRWPSPPSPPAPTPPTRR